MKKRKQLSLIRLYKLANDWIITREPNEEENRKRFEVIVDYLKYVAVHKGDNLN
jgi:hypothetical protein